MPLATKEVFFFGVCSHVYLDEAQVLRQVAAGVSQKQVSAVFGLSHSNNSTLMTKFHELFKLYIHRT